MHARMNVCVPAHLLAGICLYGMVSLHCICSIADVYGSICKYDMVVTHASNNASVYVCHWGKYVGMPVQCPTCTLKCESV